MHNTLTLIGWREWLTLPQLSPANIHAKIDTGAKTSALHTTFIEPYAHKGQAWLRFGIEAEESDHHGHTMCTAQIHDQRDVKNSGGNVEKRYVITTQLVAGNIHKEIELTLTNRKNMKYSMLLGRSAMVNTFYVNPAESHLLSTRASKL